MNENEKDQTVVEPEAPKVEQSDVPESEAPDAVVNDVEGNPGESENPYTTENKDVSTPQPIDAGVDSVPAAEPNDAEDVPAALERDTQDGSGLENDDESALPDSDFEGFASDDAEADDEESS